jgi:hypothetical protein
MTVEQLLAILSTISGIFVVIQAYLVYKVDRSRLRLEAYLGIAEKSELVIKPETQSGQNEVIILTNNGLIPIDELEAKMDVTISRKKPQDTRFHLEWERKTLLSSKEVAVIPLYEKLGDFLEDKKLVRIREEEFPSSDPETEEDIIDTLSVPDLVKPFSAILEIEVKSRIQGQTRTTKKKFRLNYSYRFEPLPFYEPDYEITIHEHMGEWKE